MKATSLLALSVVSLAAGCSSPTETSGERPSTASITQALPSPPVSGSDFAAERAFVGDPLLGLLPGQPGSLFELASDDAAGMASTTKSFTLLLAAEAVAKGHVSLDDYVTISEKAAGINNNHSAVTHSNAGLVAGEPVRFEDLLYAVMLPSGGDASIAVAQHVAVSTYPYLASESDSAQAAAFVSMMNDRAAELDLDDTLFFNSYGGDHFHFDDNTPGDSVPHRATTRDMVRWFDFGMKSELFRTVAGFQGTHAFVGLQGNFFAFTQTFGYPGMRAQKGGSNSACGTCLVADARRIGRDVLVAFTQGQPGDGTVLLDYGFAKLFHPLPQAESAPWTGGWVQSSLACVTADRAASAVVQPNGDLRILLWGLDLGARTIEHLNEYAVVWTPPGGFVIDRGGPGDPPRAPGLSVRPVDPDPPTNLGFAGLPPGGGLPPAADTFASDAKPVSVFEARIQYAENGNLVVAAATSAGIQLYSYGITGTNTVVQRDVELVGTGTDPRVQVLNASLVVTAHRNAAGDVVLRSWRLDPLTGKLSNPLDTRTLVFALPDDLELSGRPGLAVSYHLLLAHLDGSSQRVLRAFSVSHQTGEIDAESSLSWNTSSSRLALTRVTGFGTDRDIYALAYRDAQGRLALDTYEYSPAGTLSWRGTTTDTFGGPNALTPQARLQIGAYREGGVLVAVQPDPALAVRRLEPWALDASGTGSAISPNRITTLTVAERGISGTCRVPNASAEGDFLLATGEPGQEALTVQAFRSGRRN